MTHLLPLQLPLDKSRAKDLPLKGYVGLQDHGQPIELRNVHVKALP